MTPFPLPSSIRRLGIALGASLSLVLSPIGAFAAPLLKPTIYAFLVIGGNLIHCGESAMLVWSVGNATAVSISPDVGVVSGTEVAVAPRETTTYTLTATNAAGSVTQTRKITVAVTPAVRSLLAAPDSILAGAAARLESCRAVPESTRGTDQFIRPAFVTYDAGTAAD